MKSLLLLLSACTLASAAPTESTEIYEAVPGESLRYLQFLPEGYGEAAKQETPLVIFLHGAGERGTDLVGVRKHGPTKHAMEGHGYPFVLVAPQCPPGRWWKPEEVLALTHHLVETLKVDPKRIHITGLSMGGFATWACIAQEPELYASAIPICGGGDPAAVGRFKQLPIWAFHGELDESVPVAKTREMEAALTEAKAPAFRVTYFPGVGHECWALAYDNPAVFAWMMLQHR